MGIENAGTVLKLEEQLKNDICEILKKDRITLAEYYEMEKRRNFIHSMVGILGDAMDEEYKTKVLKLMRKNDKLIGMLVTISAIEEEHDDNY